ncbi:MAG: dethiobiotin synthase [Methylacidiphilales bacterium]|nr:dethiobiotin synthase [Candidatus Methylacidiphilales bacterium]MDW8349223.1 dethiobiotin synthase [Verrucomicrobiae bacterium]
MRHYYFVTGTDTGVGKTAFCAWLLQTWRKQGRRVVGLKPFATGDREDAQILQSASESSLSLDEINPFFWNEPAAPYFAEQHRALSLGVQTKKIDFEELHSIVCMTLQQFDCGVVEGAGGWRVPLSEDMDISQWAKMLGFPVIVVARNSLGTINHTLLTVERILSDGLEVKAVVLNDFFSHGAFYEDWHAAWIQKKTGVITFRWTREGRLQDEEHRPIVSEVFF